MLFIISPAKTLDLTQTPKWLDHHQPHFLEQSQILVDTMKKLSAEDISSLMKVSEKLGILNYERFHEWKRPFTPDNAKQAILTFKGDVYTGLDAASLDESSLEWADKKVMILSGLYGLLRPLDLIQAYRLEMGIKLQNPKGNNLYQFWGEEITNVLNLRLSSDSAPVLVNLASNEYYKVIQPKSVAARIVTPIFKDEKNGTHKIISFYAKKARGLMVRWAIDHRISDVTALKEFDAAGYYFSKKESTENEWVFLRDNKD